MRTASSLVALAAIGCTGLLVGPASAQAPAGACLGVDALDDADAARLPTDLADPSLCLSVQLVDFNDTVIRLVIVQNLQRPGPLWAVLHDEENAAFDTGIYAVRRYGGVMVAIENDEQRMIGGFDPNHIFAMTQSAAARCGMGRPPDMYVSALFAYWNNDFPVVGLHTNWDGFVEAGGRGTISVRRPDEKMIPFPSVVAQGRFADEDTIAMLVSSLPPAENPDGLLTINWFNQHGVHVIYRYVTEQNNDCTLADYMTLDHLGAYFNLEVEHGDIDTQVALVDLLIQFVNSEDFRGPL